jgi:hypothetical protein
MDLNLRGPWKLAGTDMAELTAPASHSVVALLYGKGRVLR